MKTQKLKGGGRAALLALCCLVCAALSGCGMEVALPYAREIDGMALMRTLGVDAAEEGVAVTGSTGVQNQAGEGDKSAVVASRKAGTISAAVLGMQAEGASYVYFGHVGQLLLGEELARQDTLGALDYVLRDVEMRLDTELYVVKDGQAGQAIEAAAEKGSAADRLEAVKEDAGLLSWCMPRTVRDVLADLERCGASFAPAVLADGALPAAGYAVFQDGMLTGWAEGDAARGVNLLLGKVDADVVDVDLPGGKPAALRVVGAKTKVCPVFDGGKLTGVAVTCRVDANLAEGDADLRDPAVLEALKQGLAETEEGRMRAALELSRELGADFLDLQSSAGMSRPWQWAELQRQWDLSALELSVTVEAAVERSYDAEW